MPVPKIPLRLIGQLERYHEWWWSRQIRKRPIVTSWNRDRRAIFVHIPKTAGTTVLEALGADPVFDTHAPARIYRMADPALFASAYKFTIVRNPWDRFASAFHFMKSGTDWPMQQQWAERYIGDMDFQQFVHKLRNPFFRMAILSERFFWPQRYWTIDRQGEQLIDSVYRFEEIGIALPALCERLGLTAPGVVPTRRSSKRAHYADLYDRQSAAMIGRIYAQDVAAFGYSFAC